MKVFLFTVVLFGLAVSDATAPPPFENRSVIRVGFDCTNTVVDGVVTSCLDCGRAWCVVSDR
jgi:hypothetical protein